MNRIQNIKGKENETAGSGKSVVIIGASLSGLLAARVLSNHFDQVTLLEKDPVQVLTESCQGQTQSQHAHGFHILESFFPGLTDELIADGAIEADMGEAIHWHQYGGFRQQYTSGLKGIVLSRPLLEWKIRRRIQELPNVAIQAGIEVERLIPNSSFSRITGLQVRDHLDGNSRRGLVADLFIDASGRGTRTPRWLVEIGYSPPVKDEIRVDLSYLSRTYRRSQNDLVSGEIVMILPDAAEDKRMAHLIPIDQDRWILEIGGWHGQPLPKDERSLIRFLRDLASPDIFHVLKDAEPLTDIVYHKFHSSRRLLFEKLNRFPDGYLVIGDALASFNPVFGQGMTSAAMQASALAALLDGHHDLSDLWRLYFKTMARLVEVIWKADVLEDFRFPGTYGSKPFTADLLIWYLRRVHKVTHHDTAVFSQFLQVMNLLEPASSLLHPRILLTVMKDLLLRRRRISAGSRHTLKSNYADLRA